MIRPEIQVITDVEEVFFDGLIEAWRVALKTLWKMHSVMRNLTLRLK